MSPGAPRSGGSSELGRQVASVLCAGMVLPDPIERMFSWIEERGLYVDTANGRLGFLFPESEMKAGWTDMGRPGGTDISFSAEGNVNLRYWFGKDDPAINGRLCVFAHTGGEGSMAAFWLDDAGRQRIVHMGSGSGSTTVCVLADDPIDFLRLLAIGYDELCWGDALSEPPGKEFLVEPNHAFRAFVREQFGVPIPDRATDIVAHPAAMGDEASPDPFWRWVKTNTST